VAVVRHDGGGGIRFERGSIRVVVGSDEGGCSGRFGSGRGVLEGGAHMHMRWWWWHQPFGSGRKTFEWGPRVGERGRGGLAGPAKGRGLVAGGGGSPMGRLRGVGRWGWKERRAATGLNSELGES
jgi:hypothetical protein